MADIMDQLAKLVDELGTPEARRRQAAALARGIMRRVNEAIAAEMQWARLKVEIDATLEGLDDDWDRTAKARLTILHRERCRAIKAVATSCRVLTMHASGDLVIDETTADTGLSEPERVLVFEVLRGADGI